MDAEIVAHRPARRPVTLDEWHLERARLLDHIRRLLQYPDSATARKRALDHLADIFEDGGLEDVQP
jgi:hypothetical protein